MKCSKLFALGTLRHFPVVIAALWVFYTVYSECSYIPVSLVDLAEVILGFGIIFALAVRLQFCFRHLMLILYAFICTICMWVEQFYGFGEWLSFAHWTAAAIGIVLIALNVIKYVLCQERNRCESK